MNRITLIELLTNLVYKKEYPKCVHYKGCAYEFDSVLNDYYNSNCELLLAEMLKDNATPSVLQTELVIGD